MLGSELTILTATDGPLVTSYSTHISNPRGLACILFDHFAEAAVGACLRGALGGLLLRAIVPFWAESFEAM